MPDPEHSPLTARTPPYGPAGSIGRAGFWLPLAALVVAAAGAAWLRFALVEPAAVAHACATGSEQRDLLCSLRDAVIAAFQQQRLSWSGLALATAGALLLWRDRPVAGAVALGFGLPLAAAGAILYGPEPGVAAVLGGVWVLSSCRRRDGAAEAAAMASASAENPRA